MHQLPSIPKFQLIEPNKLETNTNIKDKEEDQSKVSQVDILLIEEVELEDKTDQENKVEVSEMLETSKINLKDKNIKNHKKPLKLQLLKFLLKSKLNLNNHKNSL